jgi:hypothetical protein
MKRLLMLGLIFPALATFGVSTDAGWRNQGRRGWHGGASQISRQIRDRYVSRSRSFGFRECHSPPVHATWHDTSHYNYHPGEYVPHGNHLDYIRGDFALHRTGHWDTNHH